MKFKSIAVISATTIFLAYTPSALAQIAEVRAGISEFDEQTLNFDLSQKRASENSAVLAVCGTLREDHLEESPLRSRCSIHAALP